MATRLYPFADASRWMDEILGALREAPSVATMPMDLYRAGDHYVLHVDLPGVDPGSVDVSVEDNTLTIRARRTARTDTDAQWHLRERATGTYVRQLTMGRGLALDAITASFADGVLTLTIPVAEEAKPRRIEIEQPGTHAPATITPTKS